MAATDDEKAMMLWAGRAGWAGLIRALFLTLRTETGRTPGRAEPRAVATPVHEGEVGLPGCADHQDDSVPSWSRADGRGGIERAHLPALREPRENPQGRVGPARVRRVLETSIARGEGGGRQVELAIKNDGFDQTGRPPRGYTRKLRRRWPRVVQRGARNSAHASLLRSLGLGNRPVDELLHATPGRHTRGDDGGGDTVVAPPSHAGSGSVNLSSLSGSALLTLDSARSTDVPSWRTPNTS